jgi:hypothetical protein
MAPIFKLQVHRMVIAVLSDFINGSFSTDIEQLQVHTTGALLGQCWFMTLPNVRASITYLDG